MNNNPMLGWFEFLICLNYFVKESVVILEFKYKLVPSPQTYGFLLTARVAPPFVPLYMLI